MAVDQLQHDQELQERSGAPFALEGGWLCLAFCNTVGWHSGAYRRGALYPPTLSQDPPGWQEGAGAGDAGSANGAEETWQLQEGAHEQLATYRELVGWFLRNRVIGPSRAKRLLRAARERPAEAEAVRRRAIGLREALYHLFSALVAGDPPDPRDQEALNEWLPAAFARRRLAYDGERFGWRESAREDELDRVLWPVVWSAAELLTSPALARVRECANDPCGWLFVDMSRNRSRRWCDMASCGNQVKARRHYARVKQATARPSP
jgi:predicted RNA-binding Zn ribbon-like protein